MDHGKRRYNSIAAKEVFALSATNPAYSHTAWTLFLAFTHNDFLRFAYMTRGPPITLQSLNTAALLQRRIHTQALKNH